MVQFIDTRKQAKTICIDGLMADKIRYFNRMPKGRELIIVGP